jgi:hypothetical protein
MRGAPHRRERRLNLRFSPACARPREENKCFRASRCAAASSIWIAARTAPRMARLRLHRREPGVRLRYPAPLSAPRRGRQAPRLSLLAGGAPDSTIHRATACASCLRAACLLLCIGRRAGGRSGRLPFGGKRIVARCPRHHANGISSCSEGLSDSECCKIREV